MTTKLNLSALCFSLAACATLPAPVPSPPAPPPPAPEHESVPQEYRTGKHSAYATNDFIVGVGSDHPSSTYLPASHKSRNVELHISRGGAIRG